MVYSKRYIKWKGCHLGREKSRPACRGRAQKVSQTPRLRETVGDQMSQFISLLPGSRGKKGNHCHGHGMCLHDSGTPTGASAVTGSHRASTGGSRVCGSGVRLPALPSRPPQTFSPQTFLLLSSGLQHSDSAPWDLQAPPSPPPRGCHDCVGTLCLVPGLTREAHVSEEEVSILLENRWMDG